VRQLGPSLESQQLVVCQTPNALSSLRQCDCCKQERSAFRFFKDHAAAESGCAAAFSPLCPGCATAKATSFCGGGCYREVNGAYVDLFV
jgi:hypothetical protein